MKQSLKLAGPSAAEKEFISRIEEAAETDIKLCYQCGKCTAGCPAAFAMDSPPRQIIRYLQLGLVEEVMGAESIWICATCETCSARCPRGVDIASLMDACRREALAAGKIRDKKVAVFNEAFLNGVNNFGRTYEAGLLLQHNLKTMQPFKDAELGLPMMKRGKVSILPDRIKGRDQVKKIFQRIETMGRE
jgi:heterodisulfide reductase subunit C